MAVLLAGCGNDGEPEPVVPAGVRQEVARTVRNKVHGIATRAACAPPDQGQAQCQVRVSFSGRRRDHLYGVAIQGGPGWEEYSIIASWDAGSVRG